MLALGLSCRQLIVSKVFVRLEVCEQVLARTPLPHVITIFVQPPVIRCVKMHQVGMELHGTFALCQSHEQLGVGRFLYKHMVRRPDRDDLHGSALHSVAHHPVSHYRGRGLGRRQQGSLGEASGVPGIADQSESRAARRGPTR